MTLFDGQPLTEQEIAARAKCECGHALSAHVFAGKAQDGCSLCAECEGFTEAGECQ